MIGGTRARAAAVIAALGALLAVEIWTLRLGDPSRGAGRELLIRYALGWVVFGLAALMVRQVPVRSATRVILAGGAALQIVAVCFTPTTTDDFYRYIWDGNVAAHGISPYRYAPLDPELKPLRDPWLFPVGPEVADLVNRSPAKGFTDVCTTAGVPHDCTRINRPTVRTIYPPVAEAAFAGLHAVSPRHHRARFVQAAMALLAWITSAAVIAVLRRSGRDVRAAAWWAWCPVVWLECGNNAHIDVLGILLLVGALGLVSDAVSGSARRIVVAGGLFGAAVAVKLVPILLAPALLARRGVLLLGAAATFIALAYLPHVATVGAKVVGYLPGYLHEEGYSGESRFGVLRLLVPDSLAPVVAVAVLAVAALIAWRTAATRPVVPVALAFVGLAFVLVGPSQPWYGLLIVVLAALADRWEWLLIAAAAYPVYLAGSVHVENTVMQQRSYLPAAAGVALVLVARAVTMRVRSPGVAGGSRTGWTGRRWSGWRR